VKQIQIQPARSGLVVRDPSTAKALPAAGETKPRNSYWLRRLRDGDVVEVAAAKKSRRSTEES